MAARKDHYSRPPARTRSETAKRGRRRFRTHHPFAEDGGGPQAAGRTEPADGAAILDRHARTRAKAARPQEGQRKYVAKPGAAPRRYRRAGREKPAKHRCA